MNIQEQFNLINQIDYKTYKEQVIKFAEQGITSGELLDDYRITATKLNAQRMKRLDKQLIIRDELASIIRSVKSKQIWYVITEAWCGDSAQCIPVINKLALENSEHIELTIVYRDENIDFMNDNLSNGAMAIPMLVIYDDATGEKLGTWGSRPSKISEMIKNLKSENPDITKADFNLQLHTWYAEDKSESMQDDLMKLFNTIAK